MYTRVYAGSAIRGVGGLGRSLLSIFFVACLSCLAAGQNVDEIIAKCIDARGGLKKIKSVQSQRLTGRISFGPDSEGTLLMEIKRPGKIREELTVGDKSMIRISDGKAGWMIDPFSESGGMEPLDPDEMSNTAQKADLDRPLVDYKAKGYQVELVS